MNDTISAAKGISSSDHPLTIFLLVLFILAGAVIWRWGSKVVGAIEVAANELKSFLVKQTEIQGAIKNELVSTKVEIRADLASTKADLKAELDSKTDAIVDRVEIHKETIIKEIRDERYQRLASAINEALPPDSRAVRGSRPDR